MSPAGVHAIFERYRAILHEGEIDKRVQYMIESLFAARKAGFKEYPAKVPELDLVESADQITHELGLDDEMDREEMLDIFRVDAEYVVERRAVGGREGREGREGRDGREGREGSGKGSVGGR